MKNKKGKSPRKRNKFLRRKTLNAFMLSALFVAGGAAAMPLLKAGDSVGDRTYAGSSNFKQIQNNPIQFIKNENLALPDDFDYLKELNQQFAEENYPEKIILSPPEENMQKALQEKNYPAWLDSLNELEGFPEKVAIITRSEFEILSELKKRE